MTMVQNVSDEIDETAGAALRRDIASLFADARDCIGHERAAMVEWKDPDDGEQRNYCVFECICSCPEDQRSDSLFEHNRHYVRYGPIHVQHKDTVAAIREMFPDSANQRVLFRAGPLLETLAGYSFPTLWLRLGAVPLAINEFVVRD